MVNWLTLAVPFAYLGVLLGSLATFSSLYRKRKARTSFPFPLLPALFPDLLTNQIPQNQASPSPWNPGSLHTHNATSTSPYYTSTPPPAMTPARTPTARNFPLPCPTAS